MLHCPSRAAPPGRVASHLLLTLTLASTLVARSAEADEKTECVDAHGEAQVLRKSGQIRGARARLLACSAASCPLLVSRDCTRWLPELDAEQPTVILAAHDETGRDVGAVRVTLDGELLTTQLDGRPLEVDPGNHVFRGVFSDGRIAESRVIVRATEKDRVVQIDLAPSPPRAAPPATVVPAPRGGPPLATFLFGGLGAIALGSFAYFGLGGKADESRLASACRPNCAADDLNDVHRSYLAADISLGVAIVAIGAATWIALRGDRPRVAATVR
jgi:hypothetical protein